MMGADVHFYIPNRFTDGYGPNIEAFKKIIEEGTNLIVTCDNGVSGHDAIQEATKMGVEVIVTDHHEMPEVLPEAYAIVHPRHPEGQYPFGDLAGVGVAFKLATALLGEAPIECMDLVAIGTIADLVSLREENRALVIHGLEVLRNTERVGLDALYKSAGVKKNEIDEESIGFAVAPRLNAVGRLGDASPAVQLLTTFDQAKAEQTAHLIEQKNHDRKKYVKEITAEVLEMIEKGPEEQAVYVLAKENWHEGVLGIVASKVVEKTGKPAIILNIDKEKGVAKGSGSGRSVSSLHLYQALDSIRSLMEAFGGHHMAAGLSIQPENIDLLRQQLNEYAASNGMADQRKEEVEITALLKPEECTIQTVEEIKKLAPFGTDNPFPNFLIQDATVNEIRQIGADRTHLKMTLQYGDKTLDTIGFGFGNYGEWINQNTTLSLIGQLTINEWRGVKKVQIRLEDLKVEELQYFDFRGGHVPDNIWKLSHTGYLFFDPIIAQQLAFKISSENNMYLVEKNSDVETLPTNEFERFVLVDCPPTLDLLQQTLQKINANNILYIFHSQKNAYLEGIPSREQFATVYKFLASHRNIDVRNQLKLLAKTLKVKEKRLIFIISVFFEVGFVKIEDGILNYRKDAPKTDLTTSHTYQKRQLQIETEEALLFSHSSDVEGWLDHQMNGMEN